MTRVWSPSSESLRDFVGYGRKRPDPRWPGRARIAVNFAINYEEGSEYSVLDGSGRTELGLAEAPGGRVPAGQRDLAFETMYEYGSRVGIWRLFGLFLERELPATVFGCAVALERNPEVAGVRRLVKFRRLQGAARGRLDRSHQAQGRLAGARHPDGRHLARLGCQVRWTWQRDAGPE